MVRILLLCLMLVCPLQAQQSFEQEIRRLEAKPAVHGGTVFIGSSTFTLWGADLEREFIQFGAVNRGFGGSTLSDVIAYAPRILAPLQPRRVVVYAGTNDIASGRTPAQVSADFQSLVSLVRTSLPETKIAFVSLSLPPSRIHLAESFAETNRLVREYVQSAPGLYFVDVSQQLHDEQDRPRPEFFREDALHMSKAGYDRWIPVLRQALTEMSQETR